MGKSTTVVECAEAAPAIAGVRALGRPRVVSFVGFSGAGYEHVDQVSETLRHELAAFDPADTLVCAGATLEGIGMVYSLAAKKGFRTAGIVSSQARSHGVSFCTDCDVVFVVNDASWGGRHPSGALSPTTKAIVDASDVMVGVGGGLIACVELLEARQQGKTVRFHGADMNHRQALARAARTGTATPTDFTGEAQALFADS